MGSTDDRDLPSVPSKVDQTLDSVASNAAHLAGALASAGYPGVAG